MTFSATEVETKENSLVSSADYYDDYYDSYYDDSYYNNDYYDNSYYNNDYYDNSGYATNDGVTVAVFGTDSYTVDLASGYYGTAININAAYSSGNNYLYGNYAANTIMAGNGSGYLWGGSDFANDVLIGGWGSDTFQCGKYEGSDSILNGASNDLVHLYDTNLSDIVAAAYNGVTLALRFNTGNVVAVACTDYVSPTFVLANGSRYAFNRVSCMWQ